MEREIIVDWDELLKTEIQKLKETDPPGKQIIRIEGKEFPDDVSFTIIHEEAFEFKNCNFKKKIRFLNSTFKKSLQIYESTINELTSSNAVFESECEIDATITNCTIYGTTMDKGWFNLISCERFTFEKTKFSDISFLFENSPLQLLELGFGRYGGTLLIAGNNNVIEKVLLKDINNEGLLSLQDIKAKNLEITGLNNYKTLRLFNIIAEGKDASFSIERSVLGKAEFNYIDFSKFKVAMVDSALIEAYFNHIIWPPEIILPDELVAGNVQTSHVKKNKKKEKELKRKKSEKQRENYRQLKFALSKQGDAVNEQKFHSLEMQALNKYLDWWKEFWTKIIIFLSHWLSDFGQSFSRPLFWLFLGHAIAFYIVLRQGAFDNSYLKVNLGRNIEWSWSWFKCASYPFFKLINPVRSSDPNFEKGWIVADLFMRVWSSYMIYSMIRTTRRFIK